MRWQRGDARDLSGLGRFDACLSLYTAFGYLGDEGDAAVLEQVRAALADGAGAEADPVEGVLRRVYAQVPQEVWPAARLSIRAQLEYLGVG